VDGTAEEHLRLSSLVLVTAGATANTTTRNSRASRESRLLCSLTVYTQGLTRLLMDSTSEEHLRLFSLVLVTAGATAGARANEHGNDFDFTVSLRKIP